LAVDDAEVEQIVETGDNTAPDIEIILRNSEIKRIMALKLSRKNALKFCKIWALKF
jgi:hypothetical protein